MNVEYLALGFVLLFFSLGIIFLPEAFNIGSIIGIAVFLIGVGFIEKSKSKKKKEK